jgi:hypothetical protein
LKIGYIPFRGKDMLEGLKKFCRALKRDYSSRVARWTCGTAVLLGAAIGICTGAAVPGALAGILFAGVLAGSFAARDEVSMRRKNDIDLGFVQQGGFSVGSVPLMAFWHLQGPGKNISIVSNTQKLIDAVTAKYRNDAQLPAPVVAKLQPYLKDAEEAALDIKLVLPSDKPLEAPVFEFFRTVFNAAGQTERQPVASVPLPSYTPPPWEAERLAREAEVRHLADVEQMAADMLTGTDKALTMRTLRLKPKAGLSR